MNIPLRVPRPAPRLTSSEKPKSVPPPLPNRAARCTPSGTVPVARQQGHDRVVELLFEAMAALDAEHDALSAARVCLDALASAIPCRALMVHAFDAPRRDFIVVHARGEHAESMVLTRHPSTDPLLRVAMPTGEPFAWPDVRKAPVNSLARFADLPGVRTILEAPVVSGPRWLGAFELIDPFYGAAFRTEDALGARYVANRYAQFLTSHGLVLDIAMVARFANTTFAELHHRT